MHYYLITILLSLISLNASAELTPEQLDSWFNDDKMDFPEESTVQDEKLRFILHPGKKDIPLTEKTYRISAESLNSGWVAIEQCYHNLDPVGQLEVVYNYQKMRKLKVTQQTNINKLWIEGQSIQMEDVGKNASICTSAEVGILHRKENNTYLLLAGPFKRKFLDGYYPMHVKLNIQYPGNTITFNEIYPLPTPGFNLMQSHGVVQIDTQFTGKLYLAMSFTQKK